MTGKNQFWVATIQFVFLVTLAAGQQTTSTEIAQAERSLQAKAEEITLLTQQENQAQSHIRQLEKNHQVLENNHRDKVDGLQAKLDGMTSIRDSQKQLNSTINQRDRAKRQLETQKDGQAKNLEKISSQLDPNDRRLKRLRDLARQRADLNDQRARSGSRENSREANVIKKELIQSIDNLRIGDLKRIEDRSFNIRKKELEIAKLDAEIDNLKRRLQGNRTPETGNIRDTEKTLQAAKAERDTALAGSQSNLDRVNKTLAEIISKKASKANEIANQRARLEEMKKIDQLTDLDELTKGAEDTASELARKVRQLKQKENESVRLKKEAIKKMESLQLGDNFAEQREAIRNQYLAAHNLVDQEKEQLQNEIDSLRSKLAFQLQKGDQLKRSEQQRIVESRENIAKLKAENQASYRKICKDVREVVRLHEYTDRMGQKLAFLSKSLRTASEVAHLIGNITQVLDLLNSAADTGLALTEHGLEASAELAGNLSDIAPQWEDLEDLERNPKTGLYEANTALWSTGNHQKFLQNANLAIELTKEIEKEHQKANQRSGDIEKAQTELAKMEKEHEARAQRLDQVKSR